jgi:hypothetical protein
MKTRQQYSHHNLNNKIDILNCSLTKKDVYRVIKRRNLQIKQSSRWTGFIFHDGIINKKYNNQYFWCQHLSFIKCEVLAHLSSLYGTYLIYKIKIMGLGPVS